MKEMVMPAKKRVAKRRMVSPSKAHQRVVKWLVSPAGKKRTREVFYETEAALEEYRQSLRWPPLKPA